jgi:PLP dependent protein
MNETLAENYYGITRRVVAAAQANGRKSGDITLVAVSKLQSVESIHALYSLGHRDFGENYVQELLAKAEQLHALGCDGIRWHFIGHLQTNKVKTLIPQVYCVHTVDSLKVARELSQRWQENAHSDGSRLPVFIEVNIDAESTKSGVTSEATSALAAEVAALPGLALQGLMCIPADITAGPAARAAFIRLRELEVRCRPLSGGMLSMGMSTDFEEAIACGASHVRVGTALFGMRG